MTRSVRDAALLLDVIAGYDPNDPVTAYAVGQIPVSYDGNVFETESAIDKYLAQHPKAPVRTLREILLSGKVVPSRVRVLMNSVGKSTEDTGYRRVLLTEADTRQVVLTLMADNQLDALVYATFDHQPPRIGPDVMTRVVVDDVPGPGNNRRLSPILGFPAMTLPAGFTTDGLPVGLEFMGRPYAEGTLFKFGYAYEQATRHRRPPASTPGLRGEP